MNKIPTADLGTLVTANQIANKLGRSQPAVTAVIQRMQIQPLCIWGKIKYYPKSTTETVKENMRQSSKAKK